MKVRRKGGGRKGGRKKGRKEGRKERKERTAIRNTGQKNDGEMHGGNKGRN